MDALYIILAYCVKVVVFLVVHRGASMENMQMNFIPEQVKSVHLTAICGTGMASLAGMFKEAGFKVTGSDQNVYPPMSSFLSNLGIAVADGYGPQNLSPRPDLVIVGNAVSRDNPEIQHMFDMEVPYCSFPQALNRFFVSGKGALVVVGTHGKTSSSALMAWVLSCAGLNPGFMVGGIMQNLGRNYNLGSGAYFVVEGDEYDTAFFDKGPKFLHYTPSRAILTSVEFDHADIYRDFSAVRESFSKFCLTMPEEALLVGYDGDPVVRDLLVDAPCWTVRYGQRPRSPWQLGKTEIQDHVTRFEVIKRDTLFGTFTTAMVGRHNLLNALAVIAVCDDLRIPVDIIAHALKTFQGVKRRQEVRGEKSGILVMDDFAHHPTEVRATVTAVRSTYLERRLVAVFEPRTNSSMRNVFQKAYVEVFDDADLVCLRKPSRLDKVPPDQRFSSEQLVADLRERGKEAHHFQDTESIIAHLVSTLRQGDLVLIMSNGGFDNIHERLLQSL